MTLPIKPVYLPMEAQVVDEIPRGEQWQYEPKWDGFRCIAFRDGDQVQLQSKTGQPMAFYREIQRMGSTRSEASR